MLGIVMSIIGVSFKIAAVPMHFYTPDVYQGAATPVSGVHAQRGGVHHADAAQRVGWRYGAQGCSFEAIRVLLWVMAALTMTVGNVLAWLQTSVEADALAYSSVAHQGT
ncbi:MAG: proton-conducting transporter membrane subunit [Phycisphaerales bacterium]